MKEELIRYWGLAQRQWDQLSSRDKLALQALMGVLGLLVFVFVLCKPIIDFKNAAQVRYLANTELLNLVNSQRYLSGSQTNNGPVERSLVSVVTRSSQRYQLVVSRYEPKKDEGIRVKFESADFNRLVAWLQYVRQNHEVSVDDITIERGKVAGLVRANVVLEK